MLQYNDNKNSTLKHDLIIATVPALLAIALQKALDEVSDYFRRKRSELEEKEEKTKELKQSEKESKPELNSKNE